MIHPTKIAAILGGEAILKDRIGSLFDLDRHVEKGFPKKSLRHLAQFVSIKYLPRTFIYEVVPQDDYKKRRTYLTSQESAKTERLARVIATALEVLETPENAQDFLLSPHPFFYNREPLFFAFTELGARQVEEHLWEISQGLPL